MTRIVKLLALPALVVTLGIPPLAGCSRKPAGVSADSNSARTPVQAENGRQAGNGAGGQAEDRVPTGDSPEAAPEDHNAGNQPRVPAEQDPRVVAELAESGAELERDEQGIVVGIRAVGMSPEAAAAVLSKLPALPRLEKLVLTGTPLNADDLDALKSLENLRELDLFDTDIGDDGLAALAGLSRLERLSLSGTRISDAALARLAQFRKLRTLDLRWTDITGESVQQLAALPQLSELDMSWTLVSDQQIEQLAGLKSIERLILEHTEISEQGVQRLRQSLSETEIVALDAVAAAIERGDTRDHRLIGAGVGDRYRLMAQEYQASWTEFLQRYGAAASEAQRAEIAEQAPSPRPIAERMLKLAEENPEHAAAVDALVWIMQAEERSVQDLQQTARSRLVEDYVDHPRLGEACLQLSTSTSPPVQELLGLIKEKSSVKETQGRATLALAESLSGLAEKARQVQAMDEASRNRTIHLEGLLVVGQLLDAEPAELSREAEQLFEEVSRDFGQVAGLNGTLGERAESRLFELKQLSVGNEAPEIEGQDVAGEPLKLSDYRGQVVVLTFWGHWCGPCRAMYPHERELVQRLKDEPFTLLGVNSDSDRAQLRRVMEEEGITWRSWWDGGSTRGPIARSWKIDRWPTIYVMDSKGVIRHKNVRGEALDEAVDGLLAEMAGRGDAAPPDDGAAREGAGDPAAQDAPQGQDGREDSRSEATPSQAD